MSDIIDEMTPRRADRDPGRAEADQPVAAPIGMVLGTEDSTPLQLPRGPQRGRLPAARRRRHHRPRRPGLRAGDDRRRGHRGHRPTRGRQLRLRRLPDQRRRAAGPGAGDRGDHHHPGRAGVLRAAPARRAGPPRHRRRPRARAVLRPDGPQAARSVSAATARRSTSTSISWTAPAARTSRSAASPASRPRPASRCSCCTRSSAPVSSARRAVNAKALVFSVKGEDLLFLDHANIRLDDELRAGVRPGRAARPNRSPPSASTPRPPPTT